MAKVAAARWGESSKLTDGVIQENMGRMCSADKGGCGQRFCKHECQARENEVKTQEGEG